ncbi:aminoglycoside phosphotransferase family protein [Pseudonocardiaceae bacterium YIM PH 21723]|nr:aminoglycoside phosphotransferase family protein [Pseudonocardiaceae bacterium YIM PH 21723]
MEFHTVDRGPEAFQQPVTAVDVLAMCRVAFGAGVRVMSAVELGIGMYNSTFRVELDGREAVILRVAPAPDRQFRSEWQLMRTEYASVPYLAPIASLMPRVITADFTGTVIGRDYLFQSLLPGVPAPERLGAYPRSTWAGYFAQLGAIARLVHSVRGPHFGAVTGPGFSTWSAAVRDSLSAIAGDLDSVGLDSGDVRAVGAAVADRHSEVLDEITAPCLLSGDLWTVNVLLADGAAEPTISGMLDFDRTWWGDPAADWPIRMAAAKPGTERDAFWDTYGDRDGSPGAVLRSRIYEARHLGAIRLERHRLGNTQGVTDTYADLAAVLADLTCAPRR